MLEVKGNFLRNNVENLLNFEKARIVDARLISLTVEKFPNKFFCLKPINYC